MPHPNNQRLQLIYRDRFKIKEKSAGLLEPSGLVMAHNEPALWTISDDTKKIFKLSLEGDLQKGESFALPDKGLEGITIDPTGSYLFTVKEESNEILKIDLETQTVVERHRLAAMDGYDAVASYFSQSDTNKGLEGISWNHATGNIFVLKEGNPSVLLELSPDLETIQANQVLNADNGFCDPDLNAENIDFSGLCYDPHRDCFWILSDKAQRYFLYNWTLNTVIQSSKLSYRTKGKKRDVEKAEGVAIAPDGDRLYVVSDQEVRLYVFDICE